METKARSDYPQLHQIHHPLVAHKLSLLRDVATNKKQFKELVDEITLLLVYEATKNLPTVYKSIQSPLQTLESPVLAGRKPVVVPILRAGIGMVDAFLTLMPHARVGHIGLYRDEQTLTPHRYYFKIPPEPHERQFFVCDPMLATGGSACATLDELKKEGAKNIIFVCIVASPEGVNKMIQLHPDIPIYCAQLDAKLNEHGYILPGLGDAGDRLFGTQ